MDISGNSEAGTALSPRALIPAGWIVVVIVAIVACGITLARGLGGVPILMFAVVIAAIASRARESWLTLPFALAVALIFLGFSGIVGKIGYSVPIEVPEGTAIELGGLLERAFARANERAPRIGESPIPSLRGFRLEAAMSTELHLYYDSGLRFGQSEIDKVHVVMLRDGVAAEWGGEPRFHGFGVR